MKINTGVSMQDSLFYFFLMISTVLYIYSLNFLGINISLFRILFVLWCIIFIFDLLLFKKKLKKSYGVLFGVYILIIIINLIDWFRLDVNSLFRKDIINHIINMSLVVLVVAYINNEKKLDAAIRFYILGSLVALFVAVFSVIVGHLPFEGIIRANQSELRANTNFINYGTSGYRLTSSFTDPNFYGLYLCFVIILCIYLYNYVEKRRYINVLIILNVVALVLTLSRTALLGLAAIIVVCICKIRGWLVKMMLALSAIALVSVIVLLFNFEKVDSSIFLKRLEDTKSVYSRVAYWENGLKVFTDNPIIGGGSRLLSGGDNGSPVASAHIVYLSLLAKYGLIGFFIYAIFLIYPIYIVVKNKNKLSEKYVFLIVVVYSSIFIMYWVYDFFQFLEFQYLIFGFIYSIILNRIGLVEAGVPLKAKQASLK